MAPDTVSQTVLFPGQAQLRRRRAAGPRTWLTAAVRGRRPLRPITCALHDQGRAPGKRLADGGHGLLPGAPRPRAEPGRGTHRAESSDGARGRGQSRAFGGGRPGPRPRHLPPASASRPWRRIPTSSALERDRLDAVIAGLLFHGRDAPEVSALPRG